MATSNPISGLGSNQFLQLLVAQLQNQDPLNPVTDRDFIQQLSTLNTVQGIQDLNANFAQMLKLQQLTQGADLIGKTISYTSAAGSAASGKVDAVAVQDGQFVLSVGSDQVKLDQIKTVGA
jgi:flagellar basal-body rod modification protein FlgD